MSQRELPKRQENFLKEAAAAWGESDAAIARWSLSRDMDAAEADLAASLSARVKKGEEASDALSHQLLVAPALRHGLEARAAPLRRADRVSVLALRGCGPIFAMGWSLRRRPLVAVFGLLFDVFFGASGLALLCCVSAAFATGALQWGLYASWGALLLYSIRWEPKVRARSPWLPTAWVFERVFPARARLAEALIAQEALFTPSQAPTVKLVRELMVKGSEEEAGLRSKMAKARARAIGDGFVITRHWREQSGELLDDEALERRVRQEALSVSQESELEAALPAAPARRSGSSRSL